MDFAIQQLVAAIACPLFGLMNSGAAFGLVVNGFIAASGILWGYVFSPKLSKGATLAQWTWVLPTALFTVIYFSEIRVLGFRAASSELFYPAGKSEGLGVVIFTLPTWSAIAYSLGARLRFSRVK